ncbi:hypothetical protein PG997_014920 [Apiospora hydei]|uniref:Apple domain-containing protein n=1 Tax=Apiospora hydei TaxID=1337664 RepID=A0ABR1UYG8_9PEZI
MAKRYVLLLASALCVRGQGIDFDALDALNAETNGPHYNQLEGPFVAAAALPGYSDSLSLGNIAIEVPTCGSADTYLGVRIFTSGQFNTTRCLEACSGVGACQFVNVYNLRENSNLVGQFCALYSRAWDASYAYNVGQYRGNSLFTISDSYAFANLLRPATPAQCPDEECKREIVKCFNNGPAQASAYCSQLTPFTTTVATTTPTSTTSIATTVIVATQRTTQTITVTATQTVPSSTTTVSGYYTGNAQQAKRAPSSSSSIVVATPSCIATTNYPPDRITSACSCIGVPAKTVRVTQTAAAMTTTNTNTVRATTTVTVATTSVTTTVTVTGGVATATLPAATPSPLDFEAADQSGTWTWATNNPQGWDLGVVSTPDRTNQPTRAFRVVDSQYLGFAVLTSVQGFNLQPGATYQLSLLVQTTVLDAGNTASRIYLSMFSSTGNCGAAFNPISGGVPAGNGWYRFSFNFVVVQQQDTNCKIGVTYTRNQGTATHYVDNFSVAKISN